MLRSLILYLFIAYGALGQESQDTPAQRNLKSFDDTYYEDQLLIMANHRNIFRDALRSQIFQRIGITKFEELCDKNVGKEAVTKAMNATDDMTKCYVGIVNADNMIFDSYETPTLDDVFKKYCQKTDEMKNCNQNWLIGMNPCWNRDMRDDVLRVANSVVNFVCKDEGRDIILFIKEKGQNCISSKEKGIEKCVQGINQAQKKVGFTNKCREMDQLRKCIGKELTTCSSSTAANFVDSFFHSMDDLTMCSVKYKMNNGGTSLFISFFSVLIPAMSGLLVRIFNN